MTLILKQFINFIKLLNSETGTYQIATGLSLGMMIGFAPFFSIQTLLFFFLVFIFRIQVGAAFFSAFFCSPNRRKSRNSSLEKCDICCPHVSYPGIASNCSCAS